MKATRSALFTLQNTLLAAGLALILCRPTFGADSESAPAESMATAADNSAMNIRDRDGDTMTPLDQSNQQGDIEITRAIRKGLVGDDSLGINAHNVKVITADGRVTLRGPVASTAEQAKVVAMAKQVAGSDRVQNHLDVVRP